jgi:hypothetical protein
VRSYGPRVDPDTGGLHARVSQAHDYDRVTILRKQTVGNGTIETLLVRASAPGTRRLVQLRARYTEGDTAVERIVGCDDELDEARQRVNLERDMLAAAAKPST